MCVFYETSNRLSLMAVCIWGKLRLNRDLSPIAPEAPPRLLFIFSRTPSSSKSPPALSQLLSHSHSPAANCFSLHAKNFITEYHRINKERGNVGIGY